MKRWNSKSAPSKTKFGGTTWYELLNSYKYLDVQNEYLSNKNLPKWIGQIIDYLSNKDMILLSPLKLQFKIQISQHERIAHINLSSTLNNKNDVRVLQLTHSFQGQKIGIATVRTHQLPMTAFDWANAEAFNGVEFFKKVFVRCYGI